MKKKVKIKTKRCEIIFKHYLPAYTPGKRENNLPNEICTIDDLRGINCGNPIKNKCLARRVKNSTKK